MQLGGGLGWVEVLSLCKINSVRRGGSEECGFCYSCSCCCRRSRRERFYIR